MGIFIGIACPKRRIEGFGIHEGCWMWVRLCVCVYVSPCRHFIF